MSRLIISLGLFLLTIIFIIIAVVVGKKYVTSDNNKSDCEKRNTVATSKPGDTCYEWNSSNICLKGVWNKDASACVHKTEISVLILFILAAISFILCLVFLAMGIFGKKKNKRKKN